MNLSDINITLPQDKLDNVKRLSRSDSWTFYDTAPIGKSEGIEELDRISSTEEDILDKEVRFDRTSNASNESQASIQNSLYENLSPQKTQVEKEIKLNNIENRQQSSKSLLFEFDPFAKTSDENVYSNFENNDLMLLETLLATNDTPNSSGSILDFQETVDSEEIQNDINEKDAEHISSVPPEPPRRFDSLPKNEYDEVTEILLQSDKNTIGKNPALLPKLAHLVTRKQPAAPPRKLTTKNRLSQTSFPPIISVSVSTTATASDDSGSYFIIKFR